MMISRYDGKGDFTLEHGEWDALISDIVAHRGDWEGCAMRQTVTNIFHVKEEVAGLTRELRELHHHRAQQFQSLQALVKQRFPNGIPRHGVPGAAGSKKAPPANAPPPAPLEKPTAHRP